MSINLVDNYINSSGAKVAPQMSGVDRQSKSKLDVSQPLKPLPPKGKFVKDNIFYIPVNFVKGTIYDCKAFNHCLKGDANDHELGKMNDLGLKIGGLAIASYLFTQHNSPKTKAMEFVGLGSFLASMVLWPKLAIQIPAQLIHGVNVQKQYVDSYGRKKPFYLDPQYIPWDLYSDKDINKIGDRLNVPENMKNRRDFIQEKMRKIAVQNNTLWMLTTGFATPIMSALICNVSEKPVSNLISMYRSYIADKMLKNINSKSDKNLEKSVMKKIDQIIIDSNISKIDGETLDNISKVLTEGMGSVYENLFKQDLSNVFKGNGVYLDYNAVQKLTENLSNFLMGREMGGEVIHANGVEAIVPKTSEYIEFLKSNNLYETFIPAEHFAISRSKIISFLNIRMKNYKMINSDFNISFADVRNAIMEQSAENNPIQSVFNNSNCLIMDNEQKDKLRKIAKIMIDFKTKYNILDKFAFLKAAKAPETVFATAWNNSIDDIVNALGFTNKEIYEMKNDTAIAEEFIQKKLINIAANPDLYSKVIKKIAYTRNKFNKNIYIDKNYENALDTVFDKTAEDLSKLGFESFCKDLNGAVDYHNVSHVSLKALQKKFVNDRLLDIKSTMNRLVCTLDLYKRIADSNYLNGVLNDNVTPREVKEEIAKLAQKIMIMGRAKDYETKFFELRNLFPNKNDKNPLEVRYGKAVKSYGNEESVVKGNIPQDSVFYEKLVKLLYNENMHSDTESVLNDSKLLDEIKTYRSEMLDKVCWNFDFSKPYCGDHKGSANKLRFYLIGKPLDALFNEKSNTMFNTHKWLKIFGGFGAGLLAFTVLMQFTFGKTDLKVPVKPVKKDMKK